MRRTTLLLFAFFLGSLPAFSQTSALRINEIHYEDKWVELFYPATATGTIDASSLCFCSRPVYVAFSSLSVLSGSTTMNPGDYLVLAWNPASNFDNADGEVGLYVGCSGFGSAANMIDYMEYGAAHGGSSGRESVAVAKGIWTAGTFAPLTPSGKTLSFFGGGFGATNWAQSNPTQGAANDALPVELVAFEAEANGPAVTLQWTTASETNNAGFEVQHQVGESFARVGFVEGRGTTSQAQTYRFAIDNLSPGRHVFRLRQVDFEGAFAFSPEVEVNVELPGAFHLSEAFPNPFNPQTQFALTVARRQQVAVTVHDVLGRQVAAVFAGVLPAEQAHAFRFDAAHLPSGLYLIRAVGEQFSTSQPITLLK